MASTKQSKRKNSATADETVSDFYNTSGKAPKRKKSTSAEASSKKSNAGSGGAAKKSSSSRRSSKKSNNSKMTAIVGAFVIIIIIIIFLLFDVSYVTSNSMLPTLAKDDLVLSWNPAFVSLNIEEGRVYRLKNNESKNAPNFLRAIACDKKSVSYNNDIIKINGVPISRLQLTNDAISRPADEPEVLRESLESGISWHIWLPKTPIVTHNQGSVDVNLNTCFLAGDNRMASYDSRHTGCFDKSLIRGKALIILKSSRNDGLFGSYIKFL